MAVHLHKGGPDTTFNAAVFLDHEDTLVELDEDNNVDLGGLTEVEVVYWPDLIVGYVYADDDALAAGETTELHWSVENIGTEESATVIDMAGYL